MRLHCGLLPVGAMISLSIHVAPCAQNIFEGDLIYSGGN